MSRRWREAKEEGVAAAQAAAAAGGYNVAAEILTRYSSSRCPVCVARRVFCWHPPVNFRGVQLRLCYACWRKHVFHANGEDVFSPEEVVHED